MMRAYGSYSQKMDLSRNRAWGNPWDAQRNRFYYDVDIEIDTNWGVYAISRQSQSSSMEIFSWFANDLNFLCHAG
jgi:hypothetical protein